MPLKKMSTTKMLILYRYISLILTSIFYMVGGHRSGNTLVVIIGTSLTAVAMHYLYNQSKGNKKQIVCIVLLESIGNCIILACSGGLNSPYMWYTLNTMILSGIELGIYYMWINTVIYVGSMLWSLYAIEMKNSSTLNISSVNLNLIAGFIISAFMVQLLIIYLKVLEEKNSQAHDCLDYTLKLYETVYLFTSQEDKQKLIGIILNHMKIRKLPSGIYLDFSKDGKCIKPYSYGVDQNEINKVVSQTERAQLIKKIMQNNYETIHYEGGYIGIPICYTYYPFGMLLVKGEQNLEELRFIAYVSAVMLKKIALEELNEQLLIGNEQNRIANEIHDSIIQQLFGVSCQLYDLERKVNTIEKEDMAQILKQLRGNITDSMTDLRATIYGMSWNKQGKNNLVQKLEAFIKIMEQLHHLTIELSIGGNLNSLSIEEQKSLYRVCCEGIANGIKHGHATYISVHFNQSIQGLILSIQDNGEGFDYKKLENKNKFGLGIRNMEQLIEQIHGNFEIQSKCGAGTTIYAQIERDSNKEAV